MYSNKPLVPTTEKMVKEVINNMETDKPKASQTKKDKSISNESNKFMALDKSSSLYKSRASQRTETEEKVKPLKKTRSISSASLCDTIIKIQKPKEIKFRSDKFRSETPSVSSITIHGASITNVSPDKERILCKIKEKQISEMLITRKESIQ